MGVVKILENLNEGRYKVEVLKDTERAKKRKEALEKQVEELNKKNEELRKKLSEAAEVENQKRFEYQIECGKLSDQGDLVNQLNDLLDDKTAELPKLQAKLVIKQNTKTSLTNQLGSLTGQAKAAIQSSIIAVDADIDKLQEQIKGVEGQIKEIQKQVADLADPAKQIKELEKISGELFTAALKTRGIKYNIEINSLLILKRQKIIADYSDVTEEKDIRNVWCVDYSADLLKDSENVAAEIEDVKNQIAAKNVLTDDVKKQLNDLVLSGVPDTDQRVKDLKKAINDIPKDIEALQKKLQGLELKTQWVSVDINDENNHILIAPHTYVIQQKDIDEKDAYIAEKLGEREDEKAKGDAVQPEIDALQVKVNDNYLEITNTSFLLANIGSDSTDSEYLIQRRKNLQDKIDALRKDIEELNRKIIKLTRAQNRHYTKANMLAALILRLNDELADLNTAKASADKILLPKVTDRTPLFQPTQSSSPEAVFYNKSLLPGFQKWKPSYRLGTITAMGNNDLCTVELVDAESSQQDLNINQQNTLTNVRIKYGDCNSSAFAVGDRVVVSFEEHEQDKPTVIGFEDNPKPCGIAVTTNKWFQGSRLYNTKSSVPQLNSDFTNHGRYWYSLDRKKCLSWLNLPSSDKVEKFIYISGKQFAFPNQIEKADHLVCACFANKDQESKIKTNHTSVTGNIIFAAFGVSSEITYIVALEQTTSSQLNFISNTLKTDFTDFEHRSSYFCQDLYVADFTRDSNTLLSCFLGYVNRQGEPFDIIMRNGIDISGTGTLLVTSQALHTKLISGYIDGGYIASDMTDDHYHCVYWERVQTGSGYTETNTSGLNFDLACSVNFRSRIYTLRVDCLTGVVVNDFYEIFSKSFNGVSSGRQLEDSNGINGNGSYTIRDSFIIFHFYDAKSNTSIYTECASFLSGSVEYSPPNRTISGSQSFIVYRNTDGVTTEIGRISPDFALNFSSNRQSSEHLLNGQSIRFAKNIEIMVENNDPYVIGRLTDVSISLRVMPFTFVQRPRYIFRELNDVYEVSNLTRFDVVPFVFFQNSKGSNDKILIYRVRVAASTQEGFYSPVSPKISATFQGAFDMSSNLDEFTIETDFNDASVSLRSIS